MRLIVMGQQAFGKSALEAILERGDDEVIAVYCAPDKGDKVDPIKEFALENELTVMQPDNFKEQDVLGPMKELKSDLCVMAYVTIFVPEEARNIPTHGSICYHPSLLPLHRGPSSINWPIIWGASKTGISYFWPNDGLDEGEILLQKEFDIGPDDTLGTVYFEKAFPVGVEATLEAIDLVRAGRPPKVEQDESKATYEGWCKNEVAKINWGNSVDEVYNLIRGCNPQPGCQFDAYHFTEKNISKYSFNQTKIANNSVVTVKTDIINGNGNVKLITSEGNKSTTIMYLKPTNRTFVILKYRDRRGVLCRSKDGNTFNGTSKLVFGNPNATSNNTYKSFPIKEGSVDVAGKNLTRFFALKNDEFS